MKKNNIYTIYSLDNSKENVTGLMVVQKGLLFHSLKMLKNFYDEDNLFIVEGNKTLKKYKKDDFDEKISYKVYKIL